jgi:hypothetical protein
MFRTQLIRKEPQTRRREPEEEKRKLMLKRTLNPVPAIIIISYYLYKN